MNGSFTASDDVNESFMASAQPRRSVRPPLRVAGKVANDSFGTAEVANESFATSGYVPAAAFT